jgi:hypothetical protein
MRQALSLSQPSFQPSLATGVRCLTVHLFSGSEEQSASVPPPSLSHSRSVSCVTRLGGVHVCFLRVQPELLGLLLLLCAMHLHCLVLAVVPLSCAETQQPQFVHITQPPGAVCPSG